MRRFNYDDNEEYRDDVDKFFQNDMDDVTPEEYKMIMEQEGVFEDLQLQVVNRDLNNRLLRAAVRICEKSFWWRFYSLNTRLNQISIVYKHLKNLEEEKEEE
jgi:hypothetical protein